MNQGLYKLVFSRRVGMFVPVAAELPVAQGGDSGTAPSASGAGAAAAGSLQRVARLALALALGFAPPLIAPLWANPLNPKVVSGSATFSSIGPALTVTNSANAIINWQGFSIGKGETTQFIQPSAASAVLNRVTGTDPSQLLGTLQSNGRVFLVNPAGVLVGSGARIDVGALVATTHEIANEDFLAGRIRFSLLPNSGDVVNQGAIRAADGGYVYLVGKNVSNEGLIQANQGEVLLASGQNVEVRNSATPEVAVEITSPQGTVTNLGQVLAQSGRIGALAAAIRQQGVMNAGGAATGVVSDGGRIYLRGSNTVEVTGTTTVSAVHGQGGQIDINGGDLMVSSGATVSADGAFNGGTIALGGHPWGADSAQSLTLQAGSTVSASSTNEGDGGSITLWSTRQTTAAGGLKARGGVNGGNGGFIETSGQRGLSIRSVPDAGASKGKAGTWLIDPTDIEIVENIPAPPPSNALSNSGGTFSADALSPPQDTALVRASDIVDALTTTDVTVRTVGSSGTLTGQITVSAAVSATTTKTLTLEADVGGININNNISLGNGSLVLLAGGPINAGTISATGSIAAISAKLLSTTSVGGTSLLGNNSVGTLSMFNQATAGEQRVEFKNVGDLTIQSITNTGSLETEASGGAVFVETVVGATPGNITLTGTIDTSGYPVITAAGAAAGPITLISAGTLDTSVGSILAVGGFTSKAGEPGGAGGTVTLIANEADGTLTSTFGRIDATGGFGGSSESGPGGERGVGGNVSLTSKHHLALAGDIISNGGAISITTTGAGDITLSPGVTLRSSGDNGVQAVGGDAGPITLTAAGFLNASAGSIRANGGDGANGETPKAGGRGGAVTLTANGVGPQGSSVGDVEAEGGRGGFVPVDPPVADGANGAPGSVSITANHSLQVGNEGSSLSVLASGGAVTVEAKSGDLTIFGAIVASGRFSSQRSDGEDGGTVTLTSAGVINAGSSTIFAAGGGGDIKEGETTFNGGKGGTVTIEAKGATASTGSTFGRVIASGGGGGLAADRSGTQVGDDGVGGTISLKSAHPMQVSGNLEAYGLTGGKIALTTTNGGDISIASGKFLDVRGVAGINVAGGNGGVVEVGAAGTIDFSGADIYANGFGDGVSQLPGNGGVVTITANGTLADSTTKLGYIDVSAGFNSEVGYGNGGSVAVEAKHHLETHNDVLAFGRLGGSVTLRTLGAGNITLVAGSRGIDVSGTNAFSVNTTTVTAPNVDLIAGGSGGTVTMQAAGAIDTSGVPIYANGGTGGADTSGTGRLGAGGAGGTVTLTAGTVTGLTTKIGYIDARGGTGASIGESEPATGRASGGTVTTSAGHDVALLGNILSNSGAISVTTTSGSSSGGNITLSAGLDASGADGVASAGAAGGTVRLEAAGTITTTGSFSFIYANGGNGATDLSEGPGFAGGKGGTVTLVANGVGSLQPPLVTTIGLTEARGGTGGDGLPNGEHGEGGSISITASHDLIVPAGTVITTYGGGGPISLTTTGGGSITVGGLLETTGANGVQVQGRNGGDVTITSAGTLDTVAPTITLVPTDGGTRSILTEGQIVTVGGDGGFDGIAGAAGGRGGTVSLTATGSPSTLNSRIGYISTIGGAGGAADSGNYGRGGDVTIDIKHNASIESSIYTQGGAVSVTTAGNLVVGVPAPAPTVSIDTSGAPGVSGVGGDAGSITLTSAGGSIDTSNATLWAQGGLGGVQTVETTSSVFAGGAGGNVHITANGTLSGLTSKVGFVNTAGGPGGTVSENGGGEQGAGGSINISAAHDVEITGSARSNDGAISLQGKNINLTGSIDTSRTLGSGSVSLTATGTIAALPMTSFESLAFVRAGSLTTSSVDGTDLRGDNEVGTLSAANTGSGAIVFYSALPNLTISNFEGSGTLRVGSGTGTLTNLGLIAPGSAASGGTVTIEADTVDLSSPSSVVRLRLGDGVTVGSDRLAIIGSGSLAPTATVTLAGDATKGTLDVRLQPGYNPLPGDPHQALTFTNVGSVVGIPAVKVNSVDPDASRMTPTIDAATGVSLRYGVGWAGANSGGSWNVSGNWSLGDLPLATDAVYIDSPADVPRTITIDSSAVARAIRVDADNTLSVASGGTLLVANPVAATTQIASLFRGALEVTAGGAASITSPSLTLEGGSATLAVNGTGAQLTLAGASVTALAGDGTLTLPGTGGATTVSSGGTLAVNTTGNLMLPSLTLDSGTLTGTGDVEVRGTFNVSGTSSAISGSGTFTTGSLSSGTISGALSIGGARTWSNSGTFSVTGDGRIGLSGASSASPVSVRNSGVLQINSAAPSFLSGQNAAFVNEAAGQLLFTSIESSAITNAGTASALTFSNAGNVRVNSGVLAIRAPASGVDTGSYTVASGGVLEFGAAGATRTISGDIAFVAAAPTSPPPPAVLRVADGVVELSRSTTPSLLTAPGTALDVLGGELKVLAANPGTLASSVSVLNTGTLRFPNTAATTPAATVTLGELTLSGSGALLDVAGNLTVSTSLLGSSGGNIVAGGRVSITKTAGDLLLPNVTAPQQEFIALGSSSGGAISQRFGTSVRADSVAFTASGDVGLTSEANRIGAIEGTSLGAFTLINTTPNATVSGNSSPQVHPTLANTPETWLYSVSGASVSVTNTGGMRVKQTPSSGSGTVNIGATAGAVVLETRSPLSLDGNVTATGSVSLTAGAGGALTINSTVSGSSVQLASGSLTGNGTFSVGGQTVSVQSAQSSPLISYTNNTPTAAPTPEPTAAPTPAPTAAPTPAPTAAPTPEPTTAPTPEPTVAPTPAPTAAPTPEPTAAPTPAPTAAPTPAPAPATAPAITPVVNQVVSSSTQTPTPEVVTPTQVVLPVLAPPQPTLLDTTPAVTQEILRGLETSARGGEAGLGSSDTPTGSDGRRRDQGSEGESNPTPQGGAGNKDQGKPALCTC